MIKNVTDKNTEESVSRKKELFYSIQKKNHTNMEQVEWWLMDDHGTYTELCGPDKSDPKPWCDIC